MKKSIHILGIMCLAAITGLFMSCQSTKVERVDADTVTDVNEYWNDTDVRTVCETLIADCISSNRVAKFSAQYGRQPTVMVGRFYNDSSEHIDTSIIVQKMQAAIINSDVMEFVSSGSQREMLRDEVAQQVDHASIETQKAIANETGADFMLFGSVKSIVQYDDSGKKGVRTYYVSAQLQELGTTKIVWMAENNSIKKVVTRKGLKL
ncbi:MAG: penicillin-binding protein activator LpoB [Treponema sp.]|nr:penicillin-binding protein activator LpoB [Treponema sp.]